MMVTTPERIIRPLGARVLVREDGVNDHTEFATARAAGIVIPDTAYKGAKRTGVVVEVGPGRRADGGMRIPIEVRVGDRVLYPRAAVHGEPLPGSDDLYLLDEDMLICVVED